MNEHETSTPAPAVTPTAPPPETPVETPSKSPKSPKTEKKEKKPRKSKQQAPPPPPAPVVTTAAVRYLVFGRLSATALLRALGHAGWKFTQARCALDQLKVECADATVKAQIFAGRHEQRGKVPELTKAEWKQLETAARDGLIAREKARLSKLHQFVGAPAGV